jgi:Subtilase family
LRPSSPPPLGPARAPASFQPPSPLAAGAPAAPAALEACPFFALRTSSAFIAHRLAPSPSLLPAARRQPTHHTPPPMPTFRPRLILTFCLLTLALLTLTPLLTATPAHAEEVFTSQAAAAHATDSTWIPAPATRAALCLVDTGVTPNPDTTNVIARFSIDNGTPDDLSPDHHGTLMSMIASAPLDGFGMVGAAPSINVVSVRASRDGRTFGGSDLLAGVQVCISKRTAFNIKAISLSLGGSMIKGLDASTMNSAENTVERARHGGLNVVAAAGNHPGPVDWPAAYSPVVAVGAASLGVEPCSFGASGGEIDVWAPGCPLLVSDPDGVPGLSNGSSEATAFVAGTLVQLRQLAPDVGAEQVETSLAETSHDAGFNAASLFTAVGLDAQLSLGHSLVPRTVAPIAENPNAFVDKPARVNADTRSIAMTVAGDHGERDPETIRPQLPTPSVRSTSLRGSRFSATMANRPRGIEVVAQVFVKPRGGGFPRPAPVVRIRTSRLRIRAKGTISQVSLTYRDPRGSQRASLVRVVRTG